ncbi:E3 ubiquitin-protein ligase NEURL3 [Odontesthes bonariensis]|uniref:E3 ubiquitin-protein ligase NEURL3 n=1 Tax=Odontesthes bonariensis TaxID=219752 RepID=UPI003F580598
MNSEQNVSRDIKKITENFLKVMKKSFKNSVSGSEMPHNCSPCCLGPLSFHSKAVGDKIHLSQGCRRAQRAKNTFQNGLVFSNRPVKLKERIKLRIQEDVHNWHGAIRVGFTNVPPSERSLPLPSLAIPELTCRAGHWAAPVHESICPAGSKLQFWVSAGGNIYIAVNKKREMLLSGVDLRQPLWAMVDLYGQTCGILLLGSEKKGGLFTRRSCPAPEFLPDRDVNQHHCSKPAVSRLGYNCISCLNTEIPAVTDQSCVVCMVSEARITLPCGHICLCCHCYSRVLQQFGTCPLCRQRIGSPSAERRCVL